MTPVLPISPAASSAADAGADFQACCDRFFLMCPACLDRFFTVKHGYKIFDEYGTSGKKVRWVDNPEWFARWKDGQTGMPLVDANMREIKETGMKEEEGLFTTMCVL